jgi:hypothetical protein
VMPVSSTTVDVEELERSFEMGRAQALRELPAGGSSSSGRPRQVPPRGRPPQDPSREVRATSTSNREQGTTTPEQLRLLGDSPRRRSTFRFLRVSFSCTVPGT